MLACENCRKRKVRCSGSPTSSCSNCDRQNVPCYFDLNRRRRGPRPKRLNADSADEPSTTAIQASDPKPTISRSQHQFNVPLNGQVTQRDAPFRLDALQTWRACLIKMMGGEKYQLNSNDCLVSVDQVLHLLLVFCITANSQQCPVLSPITFLKQLEDGRATRHLCHAMCAAALRFSRHTSTYRSSLREALVAEAREEMATAPGTGEYARLQKLLTISVLSMHETCQGNGLQAWYDLTTALNVLTSLRYNSAVERNDEIRAGIDMVHNYVHISVVFHSIGQAVQSSPAVLLDAFAPPPDDITSSLAGLSSPELLLRLSNLMRSCLTFSRKDFTRMTPAPWSKESKYMNFKRELDSLYILHAGDRVLDIETLENLQRHETGAGSYIMCLSMLHAVRILLNSVFMPVAVVPISSSGIHTTCSPAEQIDSSQTRRSSTTPRKSVFFPAAPSAFWKERTATSIRSARAVTLLCQSILEHGNFLLPPFLGYTLFLAGLVFLNQLQVETNNIRTDEFIEHLKTIFTVLGAMRSFFRPAHLWINVLFRVHSLDLLSESAAIIGSSAGLFSNFFQRFQGIPEPPYCPLDLDDIPSFNEPWRAATTIPQDSTHSRESFEVSRPSEISSDETNTERQSSGTMTVSTEVLINDYRGAIQSAINSMKETEASVIDGDEMRSSRAESVFSPQATSLPQPDINSTSKTLPTANRQNSTNRFQSSATSSVSTSPHSIPGPEINDDSSSQMLTQKAKSTKINSNSATLGGIENNTNTDALLDFILDPDLFEQGFFAVNDSDGMMSSSNLGPHPDLPRFGGVQMDNRIDEMEDYDISFPVFLADWANRSHDSGNTTDQGPQQFDLELDLDGDVGRL